MIVLSFYRNASEADLDFLEADGPVAIAPVGDGLVLTARHPNGCRVEVKLAAAELQQLAEAIVALQQGRAGVGV